MPSMSWLSSKFVAVIQFIQLRFVSNELVLGVLALTLTIRVKLDPMVTLYVTFSHIKQQMCELRHVYQTAKLSADTHVYIFRSILFSQETLV